MSRLDSTPQLPPLANGNESLSVRESVMDSDPTDKVSITAASLQKELSTQQTPVDTQPFVTVDQSSTTASSSALSSSDSTAAPSMSATSSPDADVAAPQGPTAASKLHSALSPTPLYPSSHHGHTRAARSASADPNHRLSNEAPGALGPRSWKKHSKLNQTNGLDTEAEINFDTDIEHPSGGSGLNTPSKRKKRPSKKVSVNDFEMMRVLGKGCAGKVRTRFFYLMFLMHSS